MIALPAVLLSNWRLLAAGAALSAAAGAGWTANGWRLEARIDEIKREHSDQVARAGQATATAQAEQRAIEAQRSASLQEVSRVASLARTRADDDRRGADAARLRLLDAARGAASRACEAGADPAPTPGGQAEPGAAMVLAVVLGRADERAGELAEAFDKARVAGEACERAYSALTKPATLAPQ